MVIVRISRESIEVGGPAADTVGATRLEAEAAFLTSGASTSSAIVSRVSIEVGGPTPHKVGATRLEAEATFKTTDVTTGSVINSRMSIEVGGPTIKTISATRIEAEASFSLTVSTPTVSSKVSRLSLEAGARRGSAGAVTPLALSSESDLFVHNWVDEAVLNSAYMTDISTAPATGAESRRGLVLKPERQLSLTWQIHGDDDTQLNRLDRLLVRLRRITNERFQVPLYMDQRELGASYLSGDSTVYLDTTKARFFNGARVVIIQTNDSGIYKSHSFHLISTIESDHITFTAPIGVAIASNAVIVPVIDCEVMLEAKAKYATSRNAEVNLVVTEVAGNSALPPIRSDTPSGTTTYLGIPVLDYDPDWITGIEKGRIRHGQSYHRGRTNAVYLAEDRSREWHKMDFTGVRGSCVDQDRDDIYRMVEFFDTRRGRLRSFWHTDREQLWTAASIDPAGTFVGIIEFGDFADFQEELEGGYIGIVMSDGTQYVRGVVTAEAVLTVYRLTLDVPLPVDLDVTQVVRIARARPTRFDKDEMQETWTHTGLMSTNLELIELLNEKYVEI